MTLPAKLETIKDLDLAFQYLYSEKQQTTDLKHLRFGQFIFNTYSKEWDNSYNIRDPFLAYELIKNKLLKEE